MPDADRIDALDSVHAPGDPQTARTLAGRRVGYGLTAAALAAVVGLAVLGGATGIDTFGVESAWARASGGGYDLQVEHASVTRGGLASPFEITVVRAGGFNGPLTIAVDQAYLQLWDLNGLSPEPSSETVAGEWVLWELDPPEGEVLHLVYDARIAPSVQSGRRGRVAVLEDGEPVVEVTFRTRVLP